MGYILELRKQVGHRPLIMTCAGVLLLNEKRELLLQKRVDNGLWGYPGGSMELGERASKTVPDGKYRRKQD